MLRSPAAPSVAATFSARASDPGASPLAVEMSDDWSRIAPACGADADEAYPGAQPAAVAKRRSWRCFHASRYGVGFTTPS